MKQKKFDFNDINIIPSADSSIVHRKTDIDIFTEEGVLPLIVSPMDTVVNSENFFKFLNEGLLVCLPRGESQVDDTFWSISLDDFDFLVTNNVIVGLESPVNILVDIANGHMKKLHKLCRGFVKQKKNRNHKLMVGNIANPETYRLLSEIGVDYVRVGIGGGSGCLTSANTGVHHPMASLVNECFKIKSQNNYKTKIVADGGFRNYDEIIKALALGADYVMLGGVLNKTLESCSKTKLFNYIPINDYLANIIWYDYPYFRRFMSKNFRGMSTKEVQKKWGKQILTTSEGISKTNKVEYTLGQWVNNFSDYLRTAMSYTDSKNLEEFKNSEIVFITENAHKRFNK
jgi:IMP dehydrogenase/GMP reductase